MSADLSDAAFRSAWADYTRNPRTVNAAEQVCRHFFNMGLAEGDRLALRAAPASPEGDGSDLVHRNPAPHAAAPLGPTGQTRTLTIGASPADRPARPRETLEKDQRIKELEEALRFIGLFAEVRAKDNRAVTLQVSRGAFQTIRDRARQALSTSRGEKDSSSANPSPLDATRHSSDETPAPSGPVRDAAKRLAHRTLEYIGWLNGSFGPPEILQSDAEMKDLALEVFRALGEPEPARVMRTKGKRP